MATKTTPIRLPPGYRPGWLAGLGTGVFSICIPFKDIVTTTYQWPRTVLGSLGLGLMFYGYYYSKGHQKPEGSQVDPEPAASPSTP